MPNARTAPKTKSSGTKAKSTGRKGPSQKELAARTVAEVMSPEPVSMIETDTLFDAARMMRDNHIGDVIVLGDTDGRVKGIVTDRDVVVRAVAEERDAKQTTIGAICTGELVFVSPDDHADKAVKLMRERAVRRLPVVEDGRPVGIVSIGDLAEQFDKKSALADISAARPNN